MPNRLGNTCRDICYAMVACNRLYYTVTLKIVNGVTLFTYAKNGQYCLFLLDRENKNRKKLSVVNANETMGKENT